MRKPRDFDAELAALTDKAKTLQARKLTQLGELVIATGADILPVEILAGALLAAADTKDAVVKEVWRKSGAAFFSDRHGEQRAALVAILAAARRTATARNRLLLRRARHDTRDWQVKRRERTRQLIELGGLVAKAGLIDLVDDDRAVILGALGEIAARLRSADREQVILLWRRRGKRMFENNPDWTASTR